MSYQTGAACTGATLYGGLAPSASTTQGILGVPAANQRGTDYHAVSITALGQSAFRTVLESFQALADRSVALPSTLPATSPTTLTGPYKRLQYQITLPSDLLASAALNYDDGTRAVALLATAGYLGGSAVTLSTPDLSAVTGWDNNWAPASGATVDWNATGSGGTPASFCSNGARLVSSTRVGQI
jgi:hypothetical protein